MKLDKVITIAREAVRLSAAVQSRHSRAQWGGNFTALILACGIVATILTLNPALIPSLDSAIAMVLSITVVISPLISRALALGTFVETATDDTQLVRVKQYGDSSWNSTKLTVGQARLTAWNYGVDKEGRVIDLASRKVVDHIRISPRERGETERKGDTGQN